MSGWAAVAQAVSKAADVGLNLYSASKAYRRSREAAQHAHQWEVADLRAAGLNPVLSATGGSGASAQAFQAAPADLDFSSGLSKDAQIDLAKEQMKNVAADTRLKNTQSESNVWSAAETARRMDRITEEIQNLRQQRGLVQAQTAAGLAGSFEALQRAGTFGSVIQMNRAHAAQAHAAAFEAYQRGLISKNEVDYYRKHPDRLTAKLENYPNIPRFLAGGLADFIEGFRGYGFSLNSGKRSSDSRINLNPSRFDNYRSY